MHRSTELGHHLRLGFARRTRPRVLPVAGLGNRAPVLGEVAVEVDAIGVVALLVRLAVGVHRSHQPQLDTVRDVGQPQDVDDVGTGVLVAMDDADHEHPLPTCGAAAHDRDRSSLDGASDHHLGVDIEILEVVEVLELVSVVEVAVVGDRRIGLGRVDRVGGICRRRIRRLRRPWRR